MLFKLVSLFLTIELLHRHRLKPLVSPNRKYLDTLDIQEKEDHAIQGEIFPTKWRSDAAKKDLIQSWGIQDLHHRRVRKRNK